MKSNFVLVAAFALCNTAYALFCDPRTFSFSTRYLNNFTPGQQDLTQYSEATMMGRCDTNYGKFHADLVLYSVTPERYCQLYNQDHFFKLTPESGTLLDGSQRTFESLGDSFNGNIDTFGWDDSVPPFAVDIHTFVMPCATYYYTDATTGTPTPSQTVCGMFAPPRC